MQKDLIRTDEERAARLQLVKANRIQRLEKSQQRLVLDTNETILPTEKSPSMCLPTTNDWIQLTNIRDAYEHFCLNPILQAEEEREEYLNAQPVKCRLKEHSFLNVLNTRLTSLAAFFRTTIPTFSIGMNGNDRQWLIRTNLHYLFLFSSMDLMNINGNQPHFVEAKACHNVYVYVYGQELLEREEYLLYKLNNLIGFDSMISKMMQIILFLSPCLVTSHMPTVNLYQPPAETVRHIFHSHEEYTRMLWSYLIYRYGEYKSYKLFMTIIGQVLEHQHGRAREARERPAEQILDLAAIVRRVHTRLVAGHRVRVVVEAETVEQADREGSRVVSQDARVGIERREYRLAESVGSTQRQQ